MSQCYVVVPDCEVFSLRCYSREISHVCAVTGHYCNAHSVLPYDEVMNFAATQPKYRDAVRWSGCWDWPRDDDRWPRHCDSGCGYAFTEQDSYQVFHET